MRGVVGISKAAPRWLVFFYSVPSKPVKNRMSVWRRLVKMGAVQLKGAVYLLPFSHEHLESLQWLTAEVVSMGGEGAYLQTESVEPMSDDDLVTLFNEARAKDFRVIDKQFSVLDRKLAAIRKGGGAKGAHKALSVEYSKLTGNLQDALRVDFFSSPHGRLLKDKSVRIKAQLAQLGADESESRPSPVMKRQIKDYQGRVWATRKRPFVDRMASAWLIRRFFDPDATFAFVEDGGHPEASPAHVLFDIQGGEFTHVGDLCTFEVMVKSFGIRDKAVRVMAEAVHELDVKDGRYPAPEARGIEDILTGIRKSTSGDIEMLTKGMDVFEMLYQSLK